MKIPFPLPICWSKWLHQEPVESLFSRCVASLGAESFRESKKMILPNFDLPCIYSKAMYILFSYTEILSLATAYYILVLTSGRIVPGVDDAAPKKKLLYELEFV